MPPSIPKALKNHLLVVSFRHFAGARDETGAGRVDTMAARHEATGCGWTAVPGGRIFVRAEKGMPIGGKIVILVHGLVVSSRYMVPLLHALAPRCRAYAPDLPGFGRSWKPDRALAIPELADALASWMDAELIETASLIGNSLGCQIIADFCIRHPGRADRVVLQGPTVNPAERNFRMQFLRQLQNSTREKGGLGIDMLKDYAAAGVGRALRTMKITLGDAIEEKLPLLDLPVLVVAGDRDPVVPLAWAREAVRLLPRGELVVIPGGAHIVNWSIPERLVAATKDFLGI